MTNPIRDALEIIAANPTDAPDAIGVTARNIARAAIAAAPAAPQPDAGSRTECSLAGVHAHSFQGPHVFHEWEPGTQPDASPTGDTAPLGSSNVTHTYAIEDAAMAACDHSAPPFALCGDCGRPLASPAPTAAPGLREALAESARELHRWHTKHRLDRIAFEDCASPYCFDARSALAPSTPDEEATRLAAWRGDSDDATVNGFLVADLREYQQACREADRKGSEWPVPPRPRPRPTHTEEATR